MNCCPLYGSDDGGPSFHVQAVRRAAKPHTCYECREQIPRGARYEHYSGKWDGEMSTFKTCLSCVEIRDHFARQCHVDREEVLEQARNEENKKQYALYLQDYYSDQGGFLFGELWSQLEENFFPHMTAGGPCFAGLSPQAKARLFDRRMTWLENADEWQRRKIFGAKR